MTGLAMRVQPFAYFFFLGSVAVVAASMEISAEGVVSADAAGEKKLLRSEKVSLPLNDWYNGVDARIRQIAAEVNAPLVEHLAKLEGDQNQNKEKTDTSTEFILRSAVGKDNIKIPKQVILTGPFATFKDIFEIRRSAKLFEWLGLSKDVYVRYFNDSHCRAYIEQNYDEELTSFFDSEKFGSFRGDLCRAAILAREGGFYVDLDMQLRVPLTKLVDDATTFMTARSYINGALNALIATTPDNPVMSATISQIRKWYRNETEHTDKLTTYGLGPVTMEQGLEDVIKESCPGRRWKIEGAQFECGPRTTMRFYTEVRMRHCLRWGELLCPARRGKRKFEGLRYALFNGPKDVVMRSPRKAKEQNFIGWTRAEDCHSLGCRVSGGQRY